MIKMQEYKILAAERVLGIVDAAGLERLLNEFPDNIVRRNATDFVVVAALE